MPIKLTSTKRKQLKIAFSIKKKITKIMERNKRTNKLLKQSLKKVNKNITRLKKR